MTLKLKPISISMEYPAEAITVFKDQQAFTFFDKRHSEDEERWITFGFSNQGRLLAVWSTERGESIRIIGARKATRKERDIYESQK